MKLLVIAFVVAGTGFAAGFFAQNLRDDDPSVEGVAAVGATVVDCPSGTVLTSYAGGSRVFAVGRTAARDWVRVRDLSSPDRTVWLSTSEVELDNDIEELPIADCPDTVGEVTALGTTTTTTTLDTTTTLGTTTTPVDTTTTTSRSTTTTNSTATSSTTTSTTPPDTTAPVISNAFVSPGAVWELDGGGISCGNNPRVAEISAFVTDDIGVDSVTASWSVEGANTAISLSGTGGTYTGDFGPFDYQSISNTAPYFVDVTITITAGDDAGNDASKTVTVRLWSTAQCFG